MHAQVLDVIEAFVDIVLCIGQVFNCKKSKKCGKEVKEFNLK